MKYYQHGDCLLKECKSPEKLDLIKHDLLFQGMNHKHKVKGDFKLYKNNEDVYLSSNECELYHDEHHTMKIPKGFYKLEIVKEYDHLLEESRQVID